MRACLVGTQGDEHWVDNEGIDPRKPVHWVDTKNRVRHYTYVGEHIKGQHTFEKYQEIVTDVTQ